MINTIILKHGLHKTEKGAQLYIKIKNSMNSNRYYNNEIIPNVNKILNILKTKPIYDIYITQDRNARLYRKSK